MSSPYRGYAPVTHDTNRTAEVITELNQLNSDVVAADNAQNSSISSLSSRVSTLESAGSGAGIYSPSALQYYLEANNGNGAGLVQTINNGTATTMTVAGFYDNRGGGFNGSNIYTTPAGGIYVMTARVRVWDSMTISCNVGMGVHDSNDVNNHYFQWNQYVAGAGSRCAFTYTRTASWGGGNQLRLYCYQDSGFAMLFSAINLCIWRIG